MPGDGPGGAEQTGRWPGLGTPGRPRRPLGAWCNWRRCSWASPPRGWPPRAGGGARLRAVAGRTGHRLLPRRSAAPDLCGLRVGGVGLSAAALALTCTLGVQSADCPAGETAGRSRRSARRGSLATRRCGPDRRGAAGLAGSLAFLRGGRTGPVQAGPRGLLGFGERSSVGGCAAGGGLLVARVAAGGAVVHRRGGPLPCCCCGCTPIAASRWACWKRRAGTPHLRHAGLGGQVADRLEWGAAGLVVAAAAADLAHGSFSRCATACEVTATAAIPARPRRTRCRPSARPSRSAATGSRSTCSRRQRRVILLHDNDLKRMTGDGRRPADLTLADLRTSTREDGCGGRVRRREMPDPARGDRPGEGKIKINIELKFPRQGPPAGEEGRRPAARGGVRGGVLRRLADV